MANSLKNCCSVHPTAALSTQNAALSVAQSATYSLSKIKKCRHDYRDCPDMCSKCDQMRPLKQGGSL